MTSLALIHAGDRQLAFPHGAIQTVERCSGSQKRICLAGKEWDIVDIDESFNIIENVRSESLVVCFKWHPFALRCAAVGSIDDREFIPLPLIMDSQDSYVRGFIPQDNQLVFVVDMDAIMKKGGVHCNVMHGV